MSHVIQDIGPSYRGGTVRDRSTSISFTVPFGSELCCIRMALHTGIIQSQSIDEYFQWEGPNTVDQIGQLPTHARTEEPDIPSKHDNAGMCAEPPSEVS